MKFLALFPLRAIPTGRADSVWSDQLEGPFLLGASNVLVCWGCRVRLVECLNQGLDLLKPGMFRVDQG